MSLKLVRNVLALVLLIAVSAAYAQGGPRGGQRPQGSPTPAMQLARLVKAMADASLPLTDTQQASILSVYQDAETAAKGDGTTSSDEATRRAQMEALQSSVRKEVRALLTEQQAKVFDAMRQPGRGGPGGGAGSSGPPSGGSASDAPPSS